MRYSPLLDVTVVATMLAWIPGAAAGTSVAAFPNGLSIGDATPTSAVLWTRVTTAGPVTFEWSLDDDFASVAGSITVRQQDPLVPAKAVAGSLVPGSTYFVRASKAGGASTEGTFRTPAAPGTSRGLRFGVSGDWRGELSPYPAATNAATADLDFFVKLGDTIYADYPSPAVPTAQCTSLWEFRLKHEEVYSTRFGLNAWADVQTSTSILSVIDDHEVTNDFQGGASPAGEPLFATAVAVAESPIVVDSKEGGFADSDDPAIWVHPTDPALSVVVGTKKNGGLSVFGLDGVVIQEINPQGVRFNNVDLVAGFELAGTPTDLFVVSDRANDLMVFFAIDPTTRTLTDVTDPTSGRVFPDVDVKEQETAYGVGCHSDAKSGGAFAFVSRRSRPQVARIELVDNSGLVGWKLERIINLPDTFPAGAGSWSPENPQVEGIVVDDELNVVYLGQEQVGIWKMLADGASIDAPALIERVREFGGDEGPGEFISADVEGLTIFPTGPGTGLLIVSSQGDDTFPVFTREGSNEYIGSFTVGGNDSVDGVQECDGADVTAAPLGSAFPMGLLVVQDGNALPAVPVEDDGEIENGATNFKLVPWETVAAALFKLPGYVNQTTLYTTGLQAFEEWNAIGAETWSGTGDDRMDGRPKLYRASRWGDDAAVFVLDARSFRDAGLPAVGNIANPLEVAAFLIASFDPTRTMLGVPQRELLKADLLAAHTAGVSWKFVVVPEPIQNLGVLAASDRFEGYAAERTDILKFVDDHDIENVVFIAADIHGTLVNNITYQTSPFGPQIATSMFEVTTGSIAFDAPFGPTVAGIAAAVGLLTPTQYAFYLALPAPAQDAFIAGLVDTSIAPLGYDPVGLDGSPVDAELLVGGYSAVHWYGWTEFAIDAETRALTVTTWGIEPYTEDELLGDPASIVAREPAIVSQFVVKPSGVRSCKGDVNGDGVVNGADIALILGNWGGVDVGDVDGSGVVDGGDLGTALAAWGGC